ncbi:uncharacterized protein [Palaemon carinicauda]|uniref:uncharacterized protein n=1 Tax=Palaemon carinicauda TaxID=392227 RepID=UPI0035B630B4
MPKKASLCRTEKKDGQTKNPRGRPKKASLCRTEKKDGQTKNPRGRPKKASLCRTEKKDGQTKNPRGRPKKASLCRTERKDGQTKNPRGRPKKASLCRTEKQDGQIKNTRGRPKKASLHRTEKHDGLIKSKQTGLRPKISSRKAKETYISQEFTTKIGKQKDNTKSKKTQSSKKSNSLEISKDRKKELLDKSMETIEKPGPSYVFDISEPETIRRGRGRPRIIRLKKVGRPKRLFNKRKISFDEDTNPVLLHERELNDFPTLEANHEDSVAEETQAGQENHEDSVAEETQAVQENHEDSVAEETQAVQEESLHNNEGSDDDLQIKLLPVFKFPQAVGSWHPSLHIVRSWAKILKRQPSQCNKEPEPPLLETNVNTDSIATGTSSMKCSEPKSFFDLSDDDGLIIPSSDEEDPEEDRVELHKEDQIEYIPSKYKNMNLRLRVKKKYSKPKSHFPLDDDDDSFMSSSDEDDGDEYTPPSYRKGKKGSQRNKIFERDSNISNPYLWPINIWEYY